MCANLRPIFSLLLAVALLVVGNGVEPPTKPAGW
jgi:hypothetical protein